jgi:hypothetical protein
VAKCLNLVFPEALQLELVNKWAMYTTSPIVNAEVKALIIPCSAARITASHSEKLSGSASLFKKPENTPKSR